MIGLGIFITISTLVIIILRIKTEVERSRLSTKGGIIVGAAFVLSIVAIASVALLTPEDSLGIRLLVLGLCIACVFSSYKFAKRWG
jgi:hypothetical protein